MGRPDPCILFAQSFVHSQLDEYVDEVLFNEPVVITACEILEQNASPSSSTISIVGATSPPSFALEVFVHCEGDSRFRRLCPAFLYSHASSNLLEVEAVITNHLVIRGSYRSLTLVIYGNTAEDLGQFNIEFELDSSLANMVSSPSEGKLVDLPAAFCSSYLPSEETLSSSKLLSSFSFELDLSVEMKDFVQLVLKICKYSIYEDTVFRVVNSIVSAVSSYVSNTTSGLIISSHHGRQKGSGQEKDRQQALEALVVARDELLELQSLVNIEAAESLEAGTADYAGMRSMTSKCLVDMYNECFLEDNKNPNILTQSKVAIQLGIALLLCSTSESCYHFVKIGGLCQIANMLKSKLQKAPATLLILLVTIEHATRHSIGCEGFLGWWPREIENVPVGSSDSYSNLLSLLVEIQRPDVASLATNVLHRFRFYEIASRYESSVLSILRNISDGGWIAADGSKFLVVVADLLTNLLKLLKFEYVIDDGFGSDFYQRSNFDQTEGLLSYKATIDYITYSKYNFAARDIDANLLFLLKERGFLPLSAALLSCPTLRSEDTTMDTFVDIAASIELVLLSLLQCRSGLTFLLLQPEATATLVLSLKGVEDLNKWECLTLRHAASLISKGFFCRPEEISMIVELHLKVVHLIDRLLASTIHSEEQFWTVWDLCAISRSDSGRQALLVVGHFPEAMSILLECLRTSKDSEVGVATTGYSPSNLVIFHCVAEIFEALVADSAASSLSCWIEYAVELHKALHSSSPGSNRKDAPTRLLEWLDAGVVYNKNGAIGLLRYAAVLASGGDAHLSSASVLVSDSMDVENVVGESASSQDSQIVDNLLGKLVSDKHFDGVSLRTTSLVQLTTAFRILAFISENSAVAASLYEEGAVTLIYVVLVTCKYMLERSSNNYGYLVDEGAECTTTSDLLLERNVEQTLIDLLIPSLLFLIHILQTIQEAKEQYRNTKLLNALLKLHREVSPKVAACATELSLPFSSSLLGLHVVCRLIVSALACWPIFGWAPGLFHCLFESMQAAPLLALGPKDVCSILCLLGDLLPEEDIWSWRKEVPALTALRSVSVGTVLGSQAANYIDWYLKPEFQAGLLVRLTQQLDKIAQVILAFSSTALDVIQDMLQILIIRISCQKAEVASSLLRPIVSWMYTQIHEKSLSESILFKVYRLLHFVASLMEHQHSQILLLKEGIVKMLAKVLEFCLEVSNFDGKPMVDSRFLGKSSISMRCWILPVLKSLSLIFHFQSSADQHVLSNELGMQNMDMNDCSSVLRLLFQLCQVLPVGRELLGCLLALKELTYASQGKNAKEFLFRELVHISCDAPQQDNGGAGTDFLDESDWIWSPPPFLSCLRKILQSLHSEDDSFFLAVEAVHTLSLVALSLCMEVKSLECQKLLKLLFGIPHNPVDVDIVEEKLKYLHELIVLLNQRSNGAEVSGSTYEGGTVPKVVESVEALLLQLQGLGGSLGECDDADTRTDSASGKSINPTMESLMSPVDVIHIWKAIDLAEKSEDFFLGSLSETFMWDCPDSTPDKLLAAYIPLKRKVPSIEAPNRRTRETASSEVVASNAFSRGMATPSISSGPSRRDTFRQRKPNTSRPPSMHVDDYVARERNIDGVSSSSNIIGSNQRGGSTSGRPPSIHVDEFMARQRERQNSLAATVGDSLQVTNAPAESGSILEKSDSSRKLKPDLDDDHEIDIVFDEESESDDQLPFPQLDDNLPNPLVTGESPPVSIVEESEGDVSGDSPVEFPLRTSVSQSDTTPIKEVPIPLDKNNLNPSTKTTFFREQSDESKYSSSINSSKGLDNTQISSVGFSYSTTFPLHAQKMSDARLPPSSFPLRESSQNVPSSMSTVSHGYFEQKIPANQPPPPPMPPPIVSSFLSRATEHGQNHPTPYAQTARDVQPPLPSGYHHSYDAISCNTMASIRVQAETVLAANSSYSAALTAPMDSKFSWATASVGGKVQENYMPGSSLRPPPPLPPMPPPYSASSMAQSLVSNSGSQSSFTSTQTPLSSNALNEARVGPFNTTCAPLPLSTFTPLLLARPASSPGALLSSSTQQGQNVPNLSAPILTSITSIPTIQTRPPPPPPPPQMPRPLHLSQQIRAPLQVPQSPQEQVMSIQRTPIQVQIQHLQVPQQLQAPQIQVYYQAQQHDNVTRTPHPITEQSQPSNTHIQLDNTSQQQDSAMTLQQYFSSPEAIQSLLSDRDKLCQLLEQHPKLMQMLQERLGQL